MKSSIILGGASDNNARHEMDFYPTPAEVTVALADFIIEKELIPFDQEIWECACGENAIISALNLKGFKNTIGTDLKDGIDYLTSEKLADYMITNPPFNVAGKFIKRSIELKLSFFALLLKSQYWHAGSRLSLFNLQRPAYILPLTWRPIFVPKRGTAPTMEFQWTVWITGKEFCEYIPLLKPKKQTTLF
jgi:hypothetical protein